MSKSLLCISPFHTFKPMAFHTIHMLIRLAVCHTLSHIDMKYIHSLVCHRHTIYLDEIQDELLAERRVKISFPTPCWALRRLDFSCKTISALCSQEKWHPVICFHEQNSRWSPQSQHAHVCWWSSTKQKDLTVKDGLGSTGADMCSKVILYAWRAVFYSSHTLFRQYHCLWHHTRLNYVREIPQFSLEIGCQFLVLSISHSMFYSFTQIPPTNPYPGPRIVPILDNCSIHHSEVVWELVEDEACMFQSQLCPGDYC